MSKTNSQYLKATKNCHVGSPEIKKQAESLIKGIIQDHIPKNYKIVIQRN